MYQQDRILQKHLVQEEKIFHFSMQNRIRNKKTLPVITKQSKQSFFSSRSLDSVLPKMLLNYTPQFQGILWPVVCPLYSFQFSLTSHLRIHSISKPSSAPASEALARVKLKAPYLSEASTLLPTKHLIPLQLQVRRAGRGSSGQNTYGKARSSIDMCY